jgi:hypothetical protein
LGARAKGGITQEIFMKDEEPEEIFVECRWCCYGVSSVDAQKADAKVDEHERTSHPEKFVQEEPIIAS